MRVLPSGFWAWSALNFALFFGKRILIASGVSDKVRKRHMLLSSSSLASEWQFK